jgi:hypothetical protein
MDIPNWVRAALETVISAMGAGLGMLSVMKVFEACRSYVGTGA